MSDRQTSKRVTRARLGRLLSAYAGAVAHTTWTADFGSIADFRRAKKAEADARAAIVKAVFP